MILNNKFDEALLLAHDLHRDQRRKGTDIAYMSHLMAVASLVIEACEHTGFERVEELAIAALLHDALEDQGHKISLEEIENRFGSLVAGIVADCSDAVVDEEGQAKPPWRERKKAYIGKIAEKPQETLLVSCADKLHNARSILSDYRRHGEAVWERFNAGRTDILWYYRTLVDGFRQGWPDNPLLDELEVVVNTICELSEKENAA
tara:strand:- start:506 stop:1120 length:615 start_codon:yes stop_codon:yes gene_type:complete